MRTALFLVCVFLVLTIFGGCDTVRDSLCYSSQRQVCDENKARCLASCDNYDNDCKDNCSISWDDCLEYTASKCNIIFVPN